MTMNDESHASVRDGGPAFPQSSLKGYVNGGGMTLRDYFAAKALQGFLTNTETAEHFVIDATTIDQVAMTICEKSYEFADAMIQARGH